MADPPLPAPPLAPPSGPLLLRGGGTVGVQTDAMAAAAVRLAALERVLHDAAHRAATAPRAGTALLVATPLEHAGVSAPVLDAAEAAALDRAAEEVAARSRAAAAQAGRVGAALRSAAAGYADAEDRARAALEALSASGARVLGEHAGSVLTVVFGAALGAWLAWSLTPGTTREKTSRLAIWMREHPRLVTTPEFVTVVRCIAGSVDDLVLGAGRITLPDRLRGPGGSGVELGGDAVLLAGGAVGLFRESPVRVRRVATDVGVVPPTGIADRLRRVPEDDQVRIEKYAAPGMRPHWIVYVDPTETFTPRATGEPWDLTSNIDGVAGRSAGSFRATEQAMTDAGVEPQDPVAFVGFSQGGLLAGMLAGSGDWNTRGLESFGGPIGNIPLPPHLAGMTVRHTDDFVPALAGPDLPSDRLLVEQRAFAGEVPTHEVAPAHQRDSYDRTAADLDAATSPQVREQLEAMRRFAADPASRPGAVATSYLYHATRTGAWVPATDEPVVPRPFTGRVTAG